MQSLHKTDAMFNLSATFSQENMRTRSPKVNWLTSISYEMHRRSARKLTTRTQFDAISCTFILTFIHTTHSTEIAYCQCISHSQLRIQKAKTECRAHGFQGRSNADSHHAYHLFPKNTPRFMTFLILDACFSLSVYC